MRVFSAPQISVSGQQGGSPSPLALRPPEQVQPSLPAAPGSLRQARGWASRGKNKEAIMLREISIEELRTRSDWDLIALQRAIGACLADLTPGTAEHTAMLRTWRSIAIVLRERGPGRRP